MVFEQGPDGQARFGYAEIGSSWEPSKGACILGQVQVVSADVIPKGAERWGPNVGSSPSSWGHESSSYPGESVLTICPRHTCLPILHHHWLSMWESGRSVWASVNPIIVFDGNKTGKFCGSFLSLKKKNDTNLRWPRWMIYPSPVSKRKTIFSR